MHSCRSVFLETWVHHPGLVASPPEERQLDKAIPEGEISGKQLPRLALPSATPKVQASGSQEGDRSRPGTLEPGEITVGSRGCVASESGS